MKSWDVMVLVDKDFPKIRPVTGTVRERIKEQSILYRGSVRLSTGRFLTDEEYLARRIKILEMQLP